jgi:hypothetical protein
VASINRYPNAKFPNSSPYQELFGKKPNDVSKFRPIGYPTLAWLDKSEIEQNHPDQPKAVKGIVIG